MNHEIEAALLNLSATLRQVGEIGMAGEIDTHMDAPQDGLNAFLRSNELWGGMGSIADQAGVGSPEKRRVVEAALIDLGVAQIAAGVTNVRTLGWIEVFKQRRTGEV